jgi:endonuclease/exonuclease/phosphatase family metal-dependent hydrolase
MPSHVRTLVCALACALAAMIAAPAAHGAEPVLTVATYNIHHAQGVDDRLDLERIATEIERTGASVIGLQEVDRHWSTRSDLVDQAGWLAARLGMDVVYGANLDREPTEASGGERRQYGTAILSEYRIRASRNTLLPRPRNGEQRGLLEAVVKVRGASVRFANTHLQHNSTVERAAQAQRIAELLDASREPVVLVGDLNARPGAPELSPLFERYDDAWVRGGAGDGFTYPSEAPNARIDYVLVSPEIRVSESTVLPSLASDHLPLTATLEAPRTKGAGRSGGGR